MLMQESCIILLMVLGFVSPDLTKDKEECSEQLTSFSTCLPFVGGNSKAPTPTCCANLRKEVNSTKKCLCMLVKDRDLPGLGFKIIANLALSLPSICQAPNNVSECLDLLKLPQNSSDAQVFVEFARSSGGSSSSPVIIGTPTSTTIVTRERRWLGVGTVAAVWHLISVFVFI